MWNISLNHTTSTNSGSSSTTTIVNSSEQSSSPLLPVIFQCTSTSSGMFSKLVLHVLVATVVVATNTSTECIQDTSHAVKPDWCLRFQNTD